MSAGQEKSVFSEPYLGSISYAILMAQQLLVAVDHNAARSRNGGQGAEGSEACLDGQDGYVLMGCCNKKEYDVKSKILILIISGVTLPNTTRAKTYAARPLKKC